MFPGFLSFIDCTEQQIPMPRTKQEKRHIIQEEEKAYRKDEPWLTTRVS